MFTNETLNKFVEAFKNWVHSNCYSKKEVDSLELITVEDIDTICGTTIQNASEEGVTF